MEEQKQKIINDLFAIRAGMSYIVELYDHTQKAKNGAYESKRKLKKDLCANMIISDLSYEYVEHISLDRVFEQIYKFEDFKSKGFESLVICPDLNLELREISKKVFLKIYQEYRKTSYELINKYDGNDKNDKKNIEIELNNIFFQTCKSYGFDPLDLEGLPFDVDYYFNKINIEYGNRFSAWISLGKIENENNYNEYVKFLNDALTFLKAARRGMVFAFKAKKLYDKLIENFEKCKAAAPELKKQCKEIVDKCAEEVTKNTELAKNVYAAFANEYSNFLDPRDWKNIDLLIYYLQTGRADSIKEALQLTDRQQQADAIVQALQEINTTLRVGLNAINNTIIACTDRIVANQQIMLSQGALQNALLANASVSSKQLDVTVHTVAG